MFLSLCSISMQFAGAINFNRNLCIWVRILPVPEKLLTSTRSMFVATDCPVTTLPEFFGDSFCYPCESQSIVGKNYTNSTNFMGTPNNIFDIDRYKPILTQQELHKAVDGYLRNSTNSSTVALTYGYPIGIWNVSQVSNFSSVFDSDRNPLVRAFVEDLSEWDTSSALSMSRMFAGASWFNGNISTWSTGRVMTMHAMFFDAFSFNGDLSRWDTSSCTSMASMFEGSDVFNGNLSSFDTSNVIDMSGMFRSAISFEGKGLTKWNTSAVTTMMAMFEETFSFTADVLSSWDVSRVVDMSEIFQHSNFNGDVSEWDVSNVQLFHYAFSGAGAFNQDISTWNISSAVNLNGMVSELVVSGICNIDALLMTKHLLLRCPLVCSCKRVQSELVRLGSSIQYDACCLRVWNV
jgi:surface protein